MSGFTKDCIELFGTNDIYVLFNIKATAKDSEVRKAYYRQSILWHPDRFNADEKEKNLATRKFQVVSKAYTILSDPEKRRIYDATGSTADDDFGDVDWKDAWRQMFKKVTANDIEEFLKNFRGSQKEMEDVKAAYIKYKGDMDKIMETVIGADVENEDRIREVIRYYIDRKEVDSFPKFANEPPSKRAKRHAGAVREAKAAEKSLKKIQENDASDTDLIAAIQKRQYKYMDFVSNIEKKYRGAGITKKAKGKKRKSAQGVAQLEQEGDEVPELVPIAPRAAVSATRSSKHKK